MLSTWGKTRMLSTGGKTRMLSTGGNTRMLVWVSISTLRECGLSSSQKGSILKWQGPWYRTAADVWSTWSHSVGMAYYSHLLFIPILRWPSRPLTSDLTRAAIVRGCQKCWPIILVTGRVYMFPIFGNLVKACVTAWLARLSYRNNINITVTV